MSVVVTNDGALEEIGQRIAFLISRSDGDRAEAGRLLFETKIGLNHGEWLPWLARHNICERRARRLMEEHHSPERVEERKEARREQYRSEVDIGHLESDMDDSDGVIVPFRANTSGNDEWYTPQKYIDLAREVMGGIDLDPASCEQAQQNVQAGKYHTKEDDGLVQPWHGKVWLNPPYTRGLIERFVEKLVIEYEAGKVSEAIILTNNFTDTEWFHRLLAVASAVCLTRGRVKFNSPDGIGNSPTNGHVFFYLGHNSDGFCGAFSSVGFATTLPVKQGRDG